MFVFPSFIHAQNETRYELSMPCSKQKEFIGKKNPIPTMLIVSFTNAFTKWKQI